MKQINIFPQGFTVLNLGDLNLFSDFSFMIFKEKNKIEEEN